MNPIEAFYSNSTVLVTGANGFLGSVLVEKLLRCFDVKKIYVLMRSKAGIGVEERMQSLMTLALFDQIRNQDAKLFEKLVAVEVDYSSRDLNIECGMLKKMQEEVEIVFHVMASVSFNSPLNTAIKTNIFGTEKVVHLAKESKNLKSFVYVSTLFSNYNGDSIDEKLYPSRLSYQKFIEVGLHNTDRENIIDNPICNPEKLPNTYTLTKHFAEKLVNHRASHLPAGIFRPPIVISSYKDLPGYADNLNGPAGLLTGVERGLIHCALADPSARSNTVPVDYCINALIATAWDVHKKFVENSAGESDLPILNYISAENNLTWMEMDRKVVLGLKPLQAQIWKVSHLLTQNTLIYTVLNFFLHTILALLLDTIALLCGKKRIYSRMLKKFAVLNLSFKPFNTRQWTFGNENYKSLVEETRGFRFQRGEHNFDYRTIDWDDFYRHYIPGIKEYVLKKAELQHKSR